MVGISMPFDREDDATLYHQAENDGLPGDSDNGEIGERDKILLPLGVQYRELASPQMMQTMHNNTL